MTALSAITKTTTNTTTARYQQKQQNCHELSGPPELFGPT